MKEASFISDISVLSAQLVLIYNYLLLERYDKIVTLVTVTVLTCTTANID